MSRELRDLLEQTARGPCDPTFDPADIATKANRQRRVGAVAVAVVVLAALVGGAAWVRSAATAPHAPFVESSPPDGAPQGWQTVQAGRAVLSVPPDWAVHRLEGQDSVGCYPFAQRAIWIGGRSDPSGSCVAPPSGTARQVGIIATPMLLIGGSWPGAQQVTVAGHDGFITDDDGQVRHYVFPELALILEVSYQPDPQVADQVLSTLRPSEGDAVEPSPAQPSVQPVAVDPGPALTGDALPAMGDEGVAV